jgi:serine/threonine protein kinase
MGALGLDDPGSEGVGATTPTVGKYQLLAILGKGGMADVFLALARGPAGFNKLAVVKRLRGSLADDPHFREMFLDEARLAARLNHPNVVHTYEVGSHADVYFIAMEYLEGQSLNKIIKEGQKQSQPFDPLFCARIMSDALAGLHHAHTLKDYDGTPLSVIHRDVSPHNIFVTYDGLVKVVDFGIAKAASSSVETEVGVLKGKVAYMSPEQAGGGHIDARADIFAAGIVLWELLTKERLMGGDSAAATLHRLLMEPIPRVSTVRGDVEPELEGILSRALEKDPRDRFQSAQEMRDALDEYIARSRRVLRADDIGRQVSGMFKKVREDIHRQVQQHMQALAEEGALAGRAARAELATLTDDSLKKVPPPSASGGQLPMLQTSSSSSGVVANLAPPAPGFETFPPPPPAPAPTPRKRGLAVWVLAAVVAVLVGFIALRARSGYLLAAHDAYVSAASPPPVQTTAFVDPPLDRPTAAPTPPSDPASGADLASTGTPPGQPGVGYPQAPGPNSRARVPVSGTKHISPAKQMPATPAAAPPPAEEVGYLTFDTYPWSKVSENGRSLGTTPLVRVALSAGPHTLTIENPEQGIKQTYSVTIKAGDTASHRLGLK